MIARMRKYFLLALSVISTSAFASESGIALHLYAGWQYQMHEKSFSVSTLPVSRKTILDTNAAFERPDWLKMYTNKVSLFLRGSLAVPTDGRYVFRVGARKDGTVTGPAAIRIGNVERQLTKDTTFADAKYAKFERTEAFFDLKLGSVPTKSGSVPILLYFSEPAVDGSEFLEWKRPGDADFSPVPPEAWSHSPDDLKECDWQVRDAEIAFSGGNRHTLRGSADVAEDGFYRLRIRRTGRIYCWGNCTPSEMGMEVDGVELHYWYEPGPAGPFDESNLAIFLGKGKHSIEIRATGAANLHREQDLSPRIWLERLAPGDERAWSVTEGIPGETVYRKGEKVSWRFAADTRGGERKFRVEVFPQRGGDKPLWNGEVALVGGAAKAEGEVVFPGDLCGAFEYVVKDGSGSVLEGPWEFLVVDPTTPEQPPKGSEMPSLRSLGERVDAVDFRREVAPGGPHLVRSDGSGGVVTNGSLVYRVTGTFCKYGCWHNLNAKDGSAPIKFLGHIKKENAKGHPHGMTECNWLGCTLRVRHPGVAHVAFVVVPTDRWRRIPVELMDPQTAQFNGVLGEVNPSGGGRYATLAVPFWPVADTIDVMMTPAPAYHGRPLSEAAVATIELREYPNGFPPMPEAAAGWNPARTVVSSGEQGNLGPEKATNPGSWEGGWRVPAARPRMGDGDLFYDYKAYFEAWRRWGENSMFNGETELVWPVHSYNMAHVVTERLPWGNALFNRGYGRRPVDKHRRNTMKAILLACEKYEVGFVADFQLNLDPERMNDVIKDCEGVSDADLEGVFLMDGRQFPAKNLNPAHPVARRFLVNFYAEVARLYGRDKALRGINIRNLNWSSSFSAWFKNWDVGYDEYTTGAFARETGVKVKGKTRDERYAELVGDKTMRERWFRWRADKTLSLREEILAAVRREAPQMSLFAFGAVPELARGDGLDEASLGRRRDLGFGARVALNRTAGIEMNHLDPVRMDGFDVRDGVARLTPMEKLKEWIWYPNGLCTGSGVFAAPRSTEAWARDFAAHGPADSITRGTWWCLPPADDAVRDWTRAFRALPSGEWRRIPGDGEASVWAMTGADGDRTWIATASLSERPSSVSLVGAEGLADAVAGGTADAASVTLAPFGLRVLSALRAPSSWRAHGDAASAKARSDAPWAVAGATRRLALALWNPGGTARRRALGILPVSELAKSGACMESLRLFRRGKPVALQVDADEVSFAIPFVEGERDAALELYIDGPSAKRLPDAFSVETNATPSATAPWEYKVSDGAFSVGFLDAGAGMLEQEGAKPFLSVVKRGSSLRQEPALPLMSLAKNRTPLRIVRSGPVRFEAEVRSERALDRDDLLERQTFTSMYATGFETRRLYRIVSGGGALEVFDGYSWRTNPGRRVCDFTGRIAVPVGEEGGIDVAIVQSEGSHLEPSGSLAVRYEAATAPGETSKMFRMFMRPSRGGDAEAWRGEMAAPAPQLRVLGLETRVF